MKTGLNNITEKEVGFTGEIKGLRGSDQLVSRLKEIGFVKGGQIRIAGKTFLGGPILLEIRGAVMALRLEEAKCILI